MAVVGLDTPGPASATGVFSARGSTNFVHADWAGFDIRGGLDGTARQPVTYLNDGNAGALWGHFTHLRRRQPGNIDLRVIGTGLGGGVITRGNVVKGTKGFGGELGHVLIPYQSIAGTDGLTPDCNCGRVGDLESLCSLTAIEGRSCPTFCPLSGPRARKMDLHQAAKLVRGLAENGDPLCSESSACRRTRSGCSSTRWSTPSIPTR